MEALKVADPNLPDVLNDRAKDNWRPLLAIAEAIGADWAEEACLAAERLSGEDDDETPAILLLEDLELLFEREKGHNLSSDTIVQALCSMEDRPCPEFERGQPITARGVARLLKPFNIQPKTVNVRGKTAKGYQMKQFKWAWERYLPPVEETEA